MGQEEEQRRQEGGFDASSRLIAHAHWDPRSSQPCSPGCLGAPTTRSHLDMFIAPRLTLERAAATWSELMLWGEPVQDGCRGHRARPDGHLRTKSAESAGPGGAGGALGRGPLGWKRRTQHLGSLLFSKDPGILAPLPLLSIGGGAPGIPPVDELVADVHECWTLAATLCPFPRFQTPFFILESS